MKSLIAYTLSASVFLISQALSQSLHHHPGASPVIDQFYSYWLQPRNGETRITSCCNTLDCYSPEQVGKVAGHWWFKHRETGRHILVPDHLVENSQPDPRESPDGRSHVCASPYGTVYCFVAGTMM